MKKNCRIKIFKFFLTLIIIFPFALDGNTQTINMIFCPVGCPSVQPLSLTGTTIDGGISRNTYESTTFVCSPLDNIELRVIWDILSNKWILQYRNTSTSSFFGNEMESTVSSAPNPPDLASGNWVFSPSSGFAAIGCTGLSQFDGTGTTNVIPVELTSFEGKNINNITELSWITDSELNNEKFEVEYATDGKTFIKIGEVEGKGTSLEQNNYSFEHTLASIKGIAYYRLKQVDFDGQFEYSKMISINIKSLHNQLTIYPNPASDKVQLNFNSTEEKQVLITVYDFLGKAIKSELLSNTNIAYDISSLNDGIYIITVENGRNKSHSKLIIKRK